MTAQDHIRNAERFEIMAELSEGEDRNRLVARAEREWKIAGNLAWDKAPKT